MSHFSLSLADGVASLSVHRLSMFEVVSTLSEVSLVDLSEDMPTRSEVVIAQPTRLRIDANLADAAAGPRTWTGICTHIKETHSAPGGLSTYEAQIVPALWLATQRADQCFIESKIMPEIVDASLAEWELIQSAGETALRIRPTSIGFSTVRRITLFCVGRSELDCPSSKRRFNRWSSSSYASGVSTSGGASHGG